MTDLSVGTCPADPTPAEVLARVRAALPTLPDLVPRDLVARLAGLDPRALALWTGGRRHRFCLPPVDLGGGGQVRQPGRWLRETLEAWARGEIDGSPARAEAESRRRPDDLGDLAAHAHKERFIQRAEIGQDRGRPSGHYRPMKSTTDLVRNLTDLSLEGLELAACREALTRAGNIVKAAELLGITRHAMKRRMVKHGLVLAPQPPKETPADAP